MAHATTTVNASPNDTMQEHPLYWNSPPFPGYTNQLTLSAGTAAAWTVPAGQWDAVVITFTAGKLYACSKSGTAAAVPVATITTGVGSFEVLNGQSRRCLPGQTVSFVNATDCTISFELYANGRRDP